ncbi:MAG: DICT sensory domain-containing protein [Microcystaceae cyanobacterium]
MSITTSVLTELLQVFPDWRQQMYFKSSLTALSHAMEDQILADKDCDRPLVIASFQQERFYRQEAQRYRRISDRTNQVYVLAASETEFKKNVDQHEMIAFSPSDSLSQEWHLVIIGQNYASCLLCREKIFPNSVDNNRRFEGIWTFDRQVSQSAAGFLLNRIVAYRPELKTKVQVAREVYLEKVAPRRVRNEQSNPDIFVQRLVTYLQAGQYKLIKVNHSLSTKEHKERLLNSITAAIRLSLNPEEILQVTVEQLGEGLGVCRCLIYRCEQGDETAQILHEFLNTGITSLKGQSWPLRDNPLFQEVVALRDVLSIDNTLSDPRILAIASDFKPGRSLAALVKSCSIRSWLLVPLFYRDRLLGMLEIHHCGETPTIWGQEDVALVDAVAAQVGVALIQAEAYANLQALNQQLEALDRTRSNLVAITGHELRTPLSTIQVCLESLANEPDMSPELRQVMLDTALADAERMRKLVQDFLTLSQLESGRVVWNTEAISLMECVELALSHLKAHNRHNQLPKINNRVSYDLPLVKADGEWLVELLAKLLDNAVKFTPTDGTVAIAVQTLDQQTLEVTVTDTGRGIEASSLETVFDRFYQEEGALRRSKGGTGLGLAICRQIVNGWGGEIWAKSEGKNLGSEFHFTLPILTEPLIARSPEPQLSLPTRNRRPTRRKKV